MFKTSNIFFIPAVTWLLVLLLTVLTIHWLPLPEPLKVNLDESLFAPNYNHIFGTDELGRDLLSRILFAARNTLLITFGATALSMTLAIFFSSVAAYKGGITDRILVILIDLFWSIPFVLFVILIVSVFGVSNLSLIITIGCINWVTAARIIRIETLKLRQQPFVFSAQAYGFNYWQIIVFQILPNMKNLLITLTAYNAVEIMTLETGLAFIGLSLPDPEPTWGGILADGLSYFSSAWWIVIAVSSVITLTLFSFRALGRYFENISNNKILKVSNDWK